MIKKIFILFVVVLTCGLFFLKPEKQENELVFWTLQLQPFEPYVKKVISEFEAQNPDIKIKWVDIPYSEGEKRTLASILSETPPDLVNLNPDFSFILAQKGALRTFTKQDVKSYLPGLMQVLSYDGKYFALPFYATSSITIYNKSLLAKSGVRVVPKTYDELYALSEQVKEKTGYYVTMPTVGENDTMLKILNKYSVSSPETINSKKAKEVLELYKQLYQSDLIPKETITQGHREVLEKYMSGEIAFLQTGSNFLNQIKENAPGVYSNTDISYQLTGDTGKYDYSLMNLIIPLRSKKQEQALKFALFLTNKDNQLEFAKLTNVLPVNKEVLNDVYFKEYSNNDLNAKARVVSANQLKNIQKPITYTKDQKELVTLVNTSVQQILLGKADTQKVLDKLSNGWALLVNNR